MRGKAVLRLLRSLGMVFVLTACTPEAVGQAVLALRPTVPSAPTPLATASPSAEVSFQPCPETDVAYRLDYSQRVVLHVPMILIEQTAVDGSAFFITIRGDGTVDSEGFENLIPVSIVGTLGACAVEGDATLRASITGTCSAGVASLLITEHWEAVSTRMICPGEEPQSTDIEQLLSKTEDRFDFRLTEDGHTQTLQSDSKALSLRCSLTLRKCGPRCGPVPEN